MIKKWIIFFRSQHLDSEEDLTKADIDSVCTPYTGVSLMSLKKHNRGVIRLGDVTTHGGKVISTAHTPTDMGKPIACIGDKVCCPKCKGVYPIVEGDSECTIEGAPIAFDGHKTACGAMLISSV
jgi:uncharacterized Zn-binding protein involved in type VI secretion